MPRINKYKIINFKYGLKGDRLLDDRTIIADATHLSLEATNTVGKSMSIQTIIQAICPLADVNKNVEDIYNVKEPIYSMIEWLLDDNKTKLLIGIGFKRRSYTAKQNTSSDSQSSNNPILKILKTDLFDYFTFIVECKNNIPIDIDTLEIKQKTKEGYYKIKSLEEARNEIILKGSEHKGQVFTFAKSSGAKYKEKLAEYGIFQKEWLEIIVKLNYSEGALAIFFKDHATNERLFKHKLFPLIEENLTNIDSKKDPCAILAEQIFNFTQEYQKNIDVIQEVEELEKLQEIIGVINTKVVNIIENENEKNCIISELNYLYVSCETRMNKLNNLSIQYKKDIDILNKEADEILFITRSRDYRKEEEVLFKLNSDLENIGKVISEHEKEKQLQQRKINIIEGIELELSIVESKKYISEKKTELDKASLNADEIEKKRINTGFSLNDLLKTDIISIDKKILDNKEQIVSFKKQKELNDKTKDLLENEEKAINNKISIYQHNIDNFNKDVTKFTNEEKSFTDFMNSQTLVEKLNFDNFINERNNDKQNKINEIHLLDEEVLKIYSKLFSYGDKCLILKNKYAITEREVENIKISISNYEAYKLKLQTLADEENMLVSSFWNKQGREEFFIKVLFDIENNKKRFFIDENRTKADKESISLMKNTSISSEFLDELDSLNIECKQGFEYLCKNTNLTEQQKNVLVKNNPLLPFSLIIAKKTFNRLKDMQLKSKTTSIVPIIISEDIENSLNTNLNSSILTYYGINMFSSFDMDLIDENKRKMYVTKLDETLNRIQQNIDDLENRNKKLSNLQYELAINLINEKDIFDLEKVKFEKKEQLRNINRDIKQYEIDIESFKKSITDIKSQIIIINKTASNVESIIINAQRLDNIYKSINFDNQEFTNCKQRIKEVVIELTSIKKSDLDIVTSITNAMINTSALEIKRTETNKRFNRYVSYVCGKKVEGDIDELEASFEKLSESPEAMSVISINKDIQKESNTLTQCIERLNIILTKLDETSIPNEFILESKIHITDEILRLNNLITKFGLSFSDMKGKCDKKKWRLEEEYILINTKYEKAPLTLDQISLIGFIRSIEVVELDKETKLKDYDDTNLEISKLDILKDSLVQYDTHTEIENIEDLTLESIKEMKKDLEAKFKNVLEVIKNLIEDYSEDIIALEDYTKETKGDYKHILILLSEYKKDFERQQNIINNIILFLSESLKKIKFFEENMDRMERGVVNKGIEYIKSVITELKKFNVLGKFQGEKIFSITLPKDERIKYETVEELIGNIKREENLTLSDVKSKITSYNLLNRAINIDTLPVKIINLQLNNKTEYVNWNEIIVKTTGGQQFCISFMMLVIMLEYKRYCETDMNNTRSGKVLLMDNPFDQISEGEFLNTLIDIAKDMNVQIISYTHIKNDSIKRIFDRIYMLTVENTMGNKEFVMIEETKVPIPDETVNHAMYNIGESSAQTSMFSTI